MRSYLTPLLLLALFTLLASSANAAELDILSAAPLPTITTPGGFLIALEGHDAAWTMTSPKGKVMRVYWEKESLLLKEADGHIWTLPGTMTFLLPDGTKITQAMTISRSEGLLVPNKLHIANGSEGILIKGLFKNKPKITKPKNAKGDRWANDAKFADGDYALLSGSRDGWYLIKSKAMKDIIAEGKVDPAIPALEITMGPKGFATKTAGTLILKEIYTGAARETPK